MTFQILVNRLNTYDRHETERHKQPGDNLESLRHSTSHYLIMKTLSLMQ